MEEEYQSKLIRTCTKCKETKPLKEFRYKLTRAQAKQQGYAGNVLVTAEGKVCVSCRPARKKLRDMTNKELMHKAASGDVPALVAKSRIEKRKAETNLLRKAGRVARWHELWAMEWEAQLREMRTHMRKISQRKSLSTKLGRKALPAFLTAYGKELRRELARLTLHYKTQRCRPTYSRWEEYISLEARERIKDAWQLMPMDERVRVREIPVMLTYRPDPEANKYQRPKNTAALEARKKLLIANDPSMAPPKPKRTYETRTLPPYPPELPPVPDDIEKWLGL